MRRGLRAWLQASATMIGLMAALPFSCGDNQGRGVDQFTPGLQPGASPGSMVNPMDPLITNGNH